MKIKSILLLLLISFTLSNCGGEKEKITLQLKLAKGNTYKITKETDASSGKIMKYKNLNELKFRVDSIGSENQYYMTIKILRIKEEMDMYGEKEFYDSSKNVDRMNRGELASHRENLPFLEADFKVVVGMNGEVIEKLSTNAYLPYDEQIVEMVNYQIPYPNEPISEGSKWEQEGVNVLLDKKYKDIFTLSKIEENKVTITVKREQEGIKGLLDDQVTTGEFVIDRSNGLIIHGTMTMPLHTGGKAKYTVRRS